MISAVIVPGHRVASGTNGNPRFPGGTIRMQLPHFRARGLDLDAFYPGTLNVSIAPRRFRVLSPRQTVPALKWHPEDPPEDFSFFDVTVHRTGTPPVSGLIYHPHPETKPTHFQTPDVLELLLPWTEGLAYGTRLELEVPAGQMTFSGD
jgi:hypothetical protein